MSRGGKLFPIQTLVHTFGTNPLGHGWDSEGGLSRSGVCSVSVIISMH